MKRTSPHPGRHIVDGTVRVFLAEALLLPTGLLTVVYLTRRLGPEGYGLFTLAVVLVTWIEWSISAIFSRVTVKFVGESTDWRPVGVVVIRLQLFASCGAMVLLWLMAAPIANMLREPILATYLYLFALDIPLFCLSHAHRSIIIGIGGYRQRALMSAARWTSRLLLIIILVELGLSVRGAILGSIGASLIECIMSQSYVRLSPFSKSTFPVPRLYSYAVPLSLFALCMRLYDKLDLFMLKLLGGSIAQVGVYSAAQNISVVPGLLALSFSPLLLSTLSQMIKADQGHEAKEMSRSAMRAVLWLLPFGGMTAGAACEIVDLIFGPSFLSAAPLLAFLIFAGLGLVMISVATAIMTAADKPEWTVALAAPMLPLATVGHLLLIPSLGAVGASLSTTLVAVFGAIATVLAVQRIWGILPPFITAVRSILICGIVFALAVFWPTPGFWLVFKISVITAVIPLAFLLLGEFSSSEIALMHSMLRWRRATEQEPDMTR